MSEQACITVPERSRTAGNTQRVKTMGGAAKPESPSPTERCADCKMPLCSNARTAEFERELRVKEATIREVHHRVKNNLQTIESLLRMQMRRTESPQVADAFSEAIDRVGAMAVAHEMLSYSHDERVEVKALALSVANQVKKGLVSAQRSIRIEASGQAGTIDAQGASSLALVIAEIVHNAIAHGLEGRDTGVIALSFLRKDDDLTVLIDDDGCGVPEGFSIGNGTRMGLVLIKTLVEEDLGGTVSGSRMLESGGSRFVVTVPGVCSSIDHDDSKMEGDQQNQES